MAGVIGELIHSADQVGVGARRAERLGYPTPLPGDHVRRGLLGNLAPLVASARVASGIGRCPAERSTMPPSTHVYVR
jgi:hypothetical protein